MRARETRGIDVCNLTMQDDERSKPYHERNNPYSAWLEKHDLALAAISKLDREALQNKSTVVKLKFSILPSATRNEGGQDVNAQASKSGCVLQKGTPASLAMLKRGPGRPPKLLNKPGLT